MTTSEGWVRAQILLATLREPPRKGSLRELVLRLLTTMKEEAEFLKWRAIGMLIIDKTKGAEAFDEYEKSAFPYIEKDKAKSHNDTIGILKREVARGPLAIKKLEKKKVRSRLHASYDQNASSRSDKVLWRIGSTTSVGRPNEPGARKD